MHKLMYYPIQRVHDCGSEELPVTCNHIRVVRSKYTFGESGMDHGILLLPYSLIAGELGSPPEKGLWLCADTLIDVNSQEWPRIDYVCHEHCGRSYLGEDGLTPREWRAIEARGGYCCALCEEECNPKPDPKTFLVPVEMFIEAMDKEEAVAKITEYLDDAAKSTANRRDIVGCDVAGERVEECR